MFWSGSAAAQSRVHSVRGAPSRRSASPVAEMCSPAPNSTAAAGTGVLTSRYWSCARVTNQSQTPARRRDVLARAEQHRRGRHRRGHLQVLVLRARHGPESKVWSSRLPGDSPARTQRKAEPKGQVLLLHVQVQSQVKEQPIVVHAPIHSRTRTTHLPGRAPCKPIDAQVAGLSAHTLT